MWELRMKWGVMDQTKGDKYWRDELVRRSRISAVKEVEKLKPGLKITEREYARWCEEVRNFRQLMSL